MLNHHSFHGVKTTIAHSFRSAVGHPPTAMRNMMMSQIMAGRAPINAASLALGLSMAGRGGGRAAGLFRGFGGSSRSFRSRNAGIFNNRRAGGIFNGRGGSIFNGRGGGIFNGLGGLFRGRGGGFLGGLFGRLGGGGFLGGMLGGLFKGLLGFLGGRGRGGGGGGGGCSPGGGSGPSGPGGSGDDGGTTPDKPENDTKPDKDTKPDAKDDKDKKPPGFPDPDEKKPDKDKKPTDDKDKDKVPPGTKPELKSTYERVMDLVNKFRKDNGKSALKLNPLMTMASQAHSWFMALTHNMSHTGKGGSSFSKRLASMGYKGFGMGENVGAGQKNPEEIVNAWINSPGHRANLLANGNEAGVGLASGYWTFNIGSGRSNA